MSTKKSPCSCETCPYHDDLRDLCRRDPPNYSVHRQGWATVRPTDWCGEHPMLRAAAVWMADVAQDALEAEIPEASEAIAEAEAATKQ